MSNNRGLKEIHLWWSGITFISFSSPFFPFTLTHTNIHVHKMVIVTKPIISDDNGMEIGNERGTQNNVAFDVLLQFANSLTMIKMAVAQCVYIM